MDVEALRGCYLCQQIVHLMSNDECEEVSKKR